MAGRASHPMSSSGLYSHTCTCTIDIIINTHTHTHTQTPHAHTTRTHHTRARAHTRTHHTHTHLLYTLFSHWLCCRRSSDCYNEKLHFTILLKKLPFTDLPCPVQEVACLCLPCPSGRSSLQLSSPDGKTKLLVTALEPIQRKGAKKM